MAQQSDHKKTASLEPGLQFSKFDTVCLQFSCSAFVDVKDGMAVLLEV